LQQLRQQARAVAQGDLAARVTPVTTVEIGDLGRAFNTMVGRLASSRVALVRAQTRMEAILAGLSDGVVLTDARGNVLRLNEAAAEMFEVEEEASTGQPFVQVSRDYEINRLLQSALAAPVHERRLAAIEHGLNRRTLLTTAHVIEDDAERLGLVVLRDISELRRLETVRREFVSNVSHELRTPLTSIRALVETLEGGAIDDPDVANDFLGRIIGEVDRLTALVEDLLDLARLEAGRTPLRLATVDPDELIRRGVDRLRPQTDRAQLKLTVAIAEHLPPVEVDSSRVEQVLLNLVHNAIKFTPPGGSIDVQVSRDGDHLLVEVRDTGIGIAEAEQTRLFERFYKSDKARRSEGTGLGLAIAKHIIQAHGGEISVRSEPGKGATFWFTLPLRQVAKASRRTAG
jgi:two-component system phosphate regulon sensor histidine kinase PhoR